MDWSAFGSFPATVIGGRRISGTVILGVNFLV